MISKRNYTLAQRVTLSAINMTEKLAAKTPYILFVGIGLLSIISIQKMVNRNVIDNCPKELSVIVYYPTAVGPSYQCVSRAQLQGPAPVFKP